MKQLHGAKKPSILALIPARGGSKGVPRKNIRDVGDKPLIAWSIEAAIQSARLDRVIVTTDDVEIAAIAQQYGAEVPFTRPSVLAQDQTTSADVVIHALDWLSTHQNYNPDLILLLQPTSPLRSTADIDAAIDLLQEKRASSIVSVCEAHPHPYWAKKVDDDGKLSEFFPLDQTHTQRQTLPPAYSVNGAIYLVDCRQFITHKSFYLTPSYAYFMPRSRSIDVDTEWDLQIADFALRVFHELN